VDVKEPHHALKQLMRICILADLTLMLAWSAEEAGKVLETYKAFENKPPDLIMEKGNADPHAKLVEALTSVKSVNKTDAATLLSTFGTFQKILEASVEDLSMCPGFGPHKAQRLHKVLHLQFKRS
jgi:DNA excision repair protein ERCC-1